MKNQNYQPLTVALLMNSPEDVKIVSKSLRELGIYAHYYTDLVDFWAQAQMTKPDLCIVDVMTTAQTGTPFHQHPFITKKQLPYVLIYKTENSFLLTHISWADSSLGTIHLDDTLSLQLKTIINRFQESLSLDVQLKDISARFEKMHLRSLKLIEQSGQVEMFKTFFDQCLEIQKDVEQYTENSDFSSAVVRRFAEWNKVNRLSFYQLASQGQRLVSPEYSKNKYLSLPTLWIGQECKEGIPSFAREMIYQVSHELFENEPMMMSFRGSAKDPDLILMIELDGELKKTFPWDSLQVMLESIYRKSELKASKPSSSALEIEFSVMLDQMDALHYHQTENDDKVLMINFFPLWQFLRKKNRGKFYFSAFFQELRRSFESSLHSSSQFSAMGAWAMIVLTKGTFLESEFKKIQEILNKFPYWKHFEDLNILMTENGIPEVKLIPPSTVHFFSLMEKEWETQSLLAESTFKIKQRSFLPSIET